MLVTGKIVISIIAGNNEVCMYGNVLLTLCWESCQAKPQGLTFMNIRT